MRADDGDLGASSDPGESGGPAEQGGSLALDTLLRVERAAVTVVVALACGATTHREYERLERIGGGLVLLCCALRERLELAGSVIPKTISAEAGAMLASDAYDSRLAAAADYLDATASHATTTLAAAEDAEVTRTLRDLITFHAEAAQWLRERAAAFAASRPADEQPYDAPADTTDEAPGSVSREPGGGETAPDDGATP